MKLQASARQAVAFAVRCRVADAVAFLARYERGEDVSGEEGWFKFPDSAHGTTEQGTFAQFCMINPDDAPPDENVMDARVFEVICGNGWASAFAAGCVLMALRAEPRQPKAARAYFGFLKAAGDRLQEIPGVGLAGTADDGACYVAATQLLNELTREEMDALGLPPCFRPRAL